MVQRCGSTSVSHLFGWQPTSCFRTTQDDPFIGAAFRPAALTALDKLQTGHRVPAPAHSNNAPCQQIGCRVPAPAHSSNTPSQQIGCRVPAPAHSNNASSQTGYRVQAPAHNNNAPSQQTGYREQAPAHSSSSAQSQQTVASLILSAALRSNDHQLPITPGPHISDTSDNAGTITPQQTGIMLLYIS